MGFTGKDFSPERCTINRFSFLIPLLLLFLFSSPSFIQAGPISIHFEGFTDSTPITTQYSGLAFQNATVITAGISLNEFEFPPNSGLNNVVFDDGGPMSITSSAPITNFAGYFTYLTQLSITAYDSADNILGSITSSFFNNLALSGDPGSSPNELLSLSYNGISKIIISGDPGGSSFTLDYHDFLDLRLSEQESAPYFSAMDCILPYHGRLHFYAQV